MFFLCMNVSNGYDYLKNQDVEYNVSQMEIDFWMDPPLSGYHNAYPPSGINCIAQKSNDENIYLITSQSLIIRNSMWESCRDQKRTVSVFKRNLDLSKNVDHIIIGEPEYISIYSLNKCYRWNEQDMEEIEQTDHDFRYNKEKEICLRKGFLWRDDITDWKKRCQCGCCQPKISPVGGEGSDYVTSCGIHEESNILYYIGGNYHGCLDHYNTQPSLVRINLTNFTFIDRTILNEIDGYGLQGNWSNIKHEKYHKYFNFPGTSQLVNNKIFLAFSHSNSGIWEINIDSNPIKLINSYQKFIPRQETELWGNSTKTITVYDLLPTLTKSLYDKNKNILYFLSESFHDNAKLLKLNLSNTNYYNKSSLTTLSGLNNIKKIKYDSIRNQYYILQGDVSSKLYKLDENFNIISLSDTCGIDELSFPIDWQVAETMELDEDSGLIYVFFNDEPYNGFSIVRINDFSFSDVHKFLFYRHGQEWTPIRMNTTIINRKTGKLFVANSADAESFFMAVSEVNLKGCAKGKVYSNNTCNNCPPGTYTNIAGLDNCKLCDYGHSTVSSQSSECYKCSKGKYANVLGTTQCHDCLIGKYSELEGSRVCIDCEAGKYSIKEMSETPTDCLECDTGKYSESGDIECILCVLGRYVSNKKSCLECPPGKYGDQIGILSHTDCKPCPLGKYNNISGRDNLDYCISCIEGKYSLTKTATGIGSCLDCEKGRYRNLNMDPGQICEICENGKFSEKGSEMCNLCTQGKYNKGDDSSDHIRCELCPSGKYNSILGADDIDKCLDCDLGKYSTTLGLNTSEGCKKCVMGKYNNILGSTSINDCQDCTEGKYMKVNVGRSDNDCLDCPVGFFSLQSSISCNNCEIGKFNSLVASSDCSICDEGKYTDEINTISCKDCPENAEPNELFDICECISGTYTVNTNDTIICMECPENFICEKGAIIETLKLNKGFWRVDKNSLEAIRCKKGYNCIGGEITNSSDDLCNIGHTGPVCDVCLKGWAKNEGKCFKCLSDTAITIRSYAFTAIFPIIICGIIVFMIKTANPESSTEQKEPLSGVVKIFMNYAQIFTLASSFEINWPEIVLSFFDRTKEFSSPKISFYSSDCTLKWTYYDKLLVYMVLPIIYCISVIIILSVYSFLCYKKNRTKNLLTLTGSEKIEFIKKNPNPIVFYKSWLYTSILIGLFLSWPTIIKQSLSVIPCKKYGNEYYLLEDLSIKCYTSRYYTYLVLSYISIIVYGFFVPFTAWNILRVRKYSLYDYESKYEMPAPISFLFLGYREEVWYYEFIVMAKKYSLILITVFLKEYSRYQMICASLFIQAAFFIHVFLRPYDSITNYGILCNKLENISLLALVVTLNSGLFFGTIEDQYNLGSFEMILIVLLFLMNILVLVYFFYYLVLLSFKEGLGKIKGVCLKLLEKDSCLVKCFNDERKELIKKWSSNQDIDTYGINLKSNEEIELFHHFFNDKKMFSHELKHYLKDKQINKLNNMLNRIRCKIEIIEKNRCWMAVLNNRLYKKLRNELVKNKNKIDEKSIEKLNDILENYVDNGIKYSRNIEDISKRALTTIRRNSIIELKNLTENPMNTDEPEFNFKSNIKLSISDLTSQPKNIIL